MKILVLAVVTLFAACATTPEKVDCPEPQNVVEKSVKPAASFVTEGLMLDLETPVEGPIGKNVLFNNDDIKIVQLTMKAGALLPDHKTDYTVIVQAVSGSGTATVDGKTVPIDTTHAVVMPPDTMHAVTATEDLVILVHHFRVGAL